MDFMSHSIRAVVCFVLLMALSQAHESYFHEKYSSEDDFISPVATGIIMAAIIFGIVIVVEDLVQWWHHRYGAARVQHGDPEIVVPGSTAPAASRSENAYGIEEAIFLIPCTGTPPTPLYLQDQHNEDEPVHYIMERVELSYIGEFPEEALPFIGAPGMPSANNPQRQ